jgi:superoxide dismutase, Fe-Mn family
MNTALQTVPIDTAAAMAPAMALALSSSFGSVASWRESFVALAHAHAGASGRAELVFEPAAATLVNRWVANDSRGGSRTVPGDDATPVLAMPLPTEPEAFIAGIDWPSAYLRYTEAVHAASAPFAAHAADVDEVLLLDVRRAGVFEAAATQLAGATWRDPACVSDWAGQLPAGREVIVYCVYGHEVGRVTAMRLQAQGVNARFLEGGIDAWQSAGHRTVPKGEAS